MTSPTALARLTLLVTLACRHHVANAFGKVRKDKCRTAFRQDAARRQCPNDQSVDFLGIYPWRWTIFTLWLLRCGLCSAFLFRTFHNEPSRICPLLPFLLFLWRETTEFKKHVVVGDRWKMAKTNKFKIHKQQVLVVKLLVALPVRLCVALLLLLRACRSR